MIKSENPTKNNQLARFMNKHYSFWQVTKYYFASLKKESDSTCH